MTELTMMDYINEEPKALKEVLKLWDFNNFNKLLTRKIHRILILATGSSLNAAFASKYFIENISGTVVIIEEPYNYLHYGTIDSEIDLVLVISQSGTSTSTINVVNKVCEANLNTLVLTSDLDSPIVKTPAKIFDLNMGVETVGYVTKGYSVIVLTLYLIGLSIAFNDKKRDRTIVQNKIEELADIIEMVPDVIERSIEYFDRHKDSFKKYKRLSCIGYGPNYGIAKEFETKFTETVRRPSSGFELEAYMHGPYLEANEKHLLLFIEDSTAVAERSKQLRKYMEEIVGDVLVITISGEKQTEKELLLSSTMFDPLLSQLLGIIPIQIWSYKLATNLGIDLAIDPFPDFDKVMKSKI